MEAFLPDSVQVVLVGSLAIVFVLSWLAGVFPDVAWLQLFRLPASGLTEEQKARRRRSANRLAALEMIVAGLALPAVYVLVTVMMFAELKTLPLVLAGAGSVLCIGLGIWTFLRNRES